MIANYTYQLAANNGNTYPFQSGGQARIANDLNSASGVSIWGTSSDKQWTWVCGGYRGRWWDRSTLDRMGHRVRIGNRQLLAALVAAPCYERFAPGNTAVIHLP